MFEEIKGWLENLSPADKQKLIENLKQFSSLKALLEAKQVVITDKETGDILIVKDHAFANEFLRLFNKLSMRGVKVIDKRKDKNTLFAHPNQKNNGALKK